MSFLFPLYLLGALAIALPVLLHLRKRPPKEKISFGSLMFLEKSPEKLTRRTRIEKWLLLALRCLAVLALALVFGRPFLKSTTLPSEMPESSLTVVLVNRSASMQRENLTDRAIEAAQKAIRDRKNVDEVAVMFFDRDARTVVGFDEWKGIDGRSRAADLKKRAAEFPVGWDKSNPGKALVEAADMIAAQGGEKEYRSQDIILISDFIEGANFDALNQFAWPEDIGVECVQISPAKSGNFSLALAAASEESRSAAELVHRVRIANASDSEFDEFKLNWEGNPEPVVTGVVPAGSSRVVKVPGSTDTGKAGKLLISGDSHPYDNAVYIAPPSPLPLSILFVSAEENPDQVGSPFFYLRRALHPTSSLSPSVNFATFENFEVRLDEAAAVVVHGAWNAELAAKLNEVAAKGKLVVALPVKETSADALAKLTGISGVKLSDNPDEKYAMLASMDFDHPVLAPFARAQIRDFTKIRFWKHRQITFPGKELPEGVSVLAKFDSGSPAWVTKSIGTGSVFVFLSGWEPQESQFALSSKFVPVLYSIFENAGYSAKAAPTYYVGEVEVVAGEKLERATEPGLFSVRMPNGSASTIGVNLHPTEGRVEPIDPRHVLSDFNIPLKADLTAEAKEKPADAATKKRLETEEKEGRQKLWKWLLIAVLLFLIAETWLSGRRGKSTSTGPIPSTA